MIYLAPQAIGYIQLAELVYQLHVVEVNVWQCQAHYFQEQHKIAMDLIAMEFQVWMQRFPHAHRELIFLENHVNAAWKSKLMDQISETHQVVLAKTHCSQAISPVMRKLKLALQNKNSTYIL